MTPSYSLKDPRLEHYMDKLALTAHRITQLGNLQVNYNTCHLKLKCRAIVDEIHKNVIY